MAWGRRMPVELDPLSQLIGAQTAQIAGIASQLTDLRSEVITNRLNAQTWREDVLTKIDLAQAEYRTVKHDYRAVETGHAAINGRLQKMEKRLGEIEGIILIWKTRAAVIMTIAIAIGSMLSMIVKPIFEAVVTRIIG